MCYPGYMKIRLTICAFIFSSFYGCVPPQHSVLTDSSGVLHCPTSEPSDPIWTVERQSIIMHTIHFPADNRHVCYAQPFPGPAENELVESCYFAYAYAGSCERLEQIHEDCMTCWTTAR